MYYIAVLLALEFIYNTCKYITGRDQMDSVGTYMYTREKGGTEMLRERSSGISTVKRIKELKDPLITHTHNHCAVFYIIML